MHRRRLLAIGGTSVLVGMSGCLATGLNNDSGNGNTEDCSQFEGEFGALSLAVPVEPPDDAPTFDIEDTTLPTLEKVGREFESAIEQYSDAKETISKHDLARQRVGWVKLGNGDRYESVDTALSEFQTTDSMSSTDKISPIDRWYTVYNGKTFRLTLLRRDYPFGRPNTNASTHVTDDPLEVTVASSAPTSADVIHADEDLIPKSEFFMTVLEVAQCKRDSNLDLRFSSAMKYDIPHEETEVLTNFEKEESGWYVEYEDEFYLFDIHFSAY